MTEKLNTKKIATYILTLIVVSTAMALVKTIDITLFGKKSYIQQEKIIEKKLQEVSNKTNQNLPRSIDKDTILITTLAGPGKYFTYFYKFNNLASHEVNMDVFYKEFQPTVIQNICLNKEQMESFFSNDVTIAFRYVGNDNQFIGEIKFNNSVCNNQK